MNTFTMDTVTIVTIIICLSIVIDIFVFVYLFKKRKTISPAFKKQIQDHLISINSIDKKMQIIELDKILDKCLDNKGYYGTLGEKMKNFPDFIDVNSIWAAHKLRNTLAHEINANPNNYEFTNAINSFKREINNIIK